MDGRTDGRTDGQTDGAILICHPKFLRGHKKREASHISSTENNNIIEILTFEIFANC